MAEKDLRCIQELVRRCMDVGDCDDDIGAGQLTVNDPMFYKIVYKARQALVGLYEEQGKGEEQMARPTPEEVVKDYREFRGVVARELFGE